MKAQIGKVVKGKDVANFSVCTYLTEVMKKFRRSVITDEISQTAGHHGMYRMHLSKFEPCPSPLIFEITDLEVLVDPALTVRDIWRRWTGMEQTYKNSKATLETS